jgi:hypothetical protein
MSKISSSSPPSLAIFLALLLAGCSGPQPQDAPTSDALQELNFEDPENDVKGETEQSGHDPGLDILRWRFVEQEELVQIDMELKQAPETDGHAYRCRFVQPPSGKNIPQHVSVNVRNGVSESEMVSFSQDGARVSLRIDHAFLWRVTWRNPVELSCMTISIGGFAEAADETSTEEITWKNLRKLGNERYIMGVGPYDKATLLVADPCCDVQRATDPKAPQDRPEWDIRQVMAWQAGTTLFLQVQFTDDPTRSTQVRFVYRQAGGGTLPTFFYEYDNETAYKRPSGETIPSSQPTPNAMRLEIPFTAIADSELEDAVQFDVHVIAMDAEGNSFLEGVSAPPYNLR